MAARRPKRAVLLCRISDGRDPDRRAVTDQEADGYDYGAYLKWGFGPRETHLVIEDGVSAYKRRRTRQPDGSVIWRTDRPEFQRLLRMLETGEADGLMAYNLDRTIRDPYDLEDLIAVVRSRKPAIPVAVVTGTLKLGNDDEVAMARTLVAFANKSSSDTARRVARSARTRAEKGKFNGGVRRFGRGVPTGETRKKRVRDRETGEVREVEVEVLDMNAVRKDEAEQIEKAVDDLLAGVSFRQVFAALKASGVKPVKGGEWASRSFQQILLSPHIAGLAVYNGTSEDEWRERGDDEEDDRRGEDEEPREKLYPAEWPAIVPEEKWRAVRELLRDPKRRTSPGNTPKWLGSLIYLCGMCAEDGKEATLTVGRGSRGKRAQTYVCKEKKHLSRVAEPLDDFVERVIIERLSRDDAADLLRTDDPAEADVVALREESLLVTRRRNDAAKLFAAGTIDATQLADISEATQRRLTEIERVLSRAAEGDPLAGIAGRPDAAEVWKSRDVGQRRAILRELFTVTVLKTGPGRPPGLKPGDPYFDPRSVRVEPRRRPAENS
ncbi:recombinase family protein [Nocardiopsis sp. HUAS JQ3]|uniref:recombinase family protein n=1 Tax=Nocardiopsis sp. HUAS JQ3 TaxID=3061629 RepID=UPI0023A934FD|nr:recombinase family protein [Nocardiopsis sp. HUAS JQ3]WDZ91184.1 recombinase family protein [Nocardiopsis sp. HUAS JQ3]